MILKYIKLKNPSALQVFDFKEKELVKIFIPDNIYDCDINVSNVAKELLNCHYRNTVLVNADDFSANWDEVPAYTLKEPKNFDELLKFSSMVCKHISMYDNLITSPVEVSRFIYGRRNYNIFRSNRIEELASKDDTVAELYLHSVDCSFEKWSLDEVKRSPVWIYEYCKKNGFNEELYNAMSMYSFTNADSLYVKKFMNTKRFVPKNIRKKVMTKKAFVEKIIEEMKKDCVIRSIYCDEVLRKCEENGYSVSQATIRKVMSDLGVN